MSRDERRISWTGLKIDPWRKKQIMAFCRQYDEWQKDLLANKNKKHQMDVESAAEAMARDAAILKKIDIVESAIKTVCPEIFDAMLDSIARGVSYKVQNVPMCSMDFYKKRIAVYSVIHENLD